MPALWTGRSLSPGYPVNLREGARSTNLQSASTALQRRDALEHLHRLPRRPTTLRARLFVSSLIVDAFCLILGFTAAVLHGQSSSLQQVEVILAAMLPVYLVTGVQRRRL